MGEKVGGRLEEEKGRKGQEGGVIPCVSLWHGSSGTKLTIQSVKGVLQGVSV